MFEGNDSELEGVMYSRQLQSVLDVCCTSLVARCVVWSGVVCGLDAAPFSSTSENLKKKYSGSL